MRRSSPKSRTWTTIALYVGNAFVACVIATLVLRLWRMEWDIPLYFSFDAVFTGSSIKAMVDNGWFWFNPHVGAPGVSSILDYPSADTAHWVVLKAIAMVTRDWAATMNAFFLLGFPVTSTVALWAFRRLGLSTPSGFAMSLLYAFLPYHLMRSEAHLFLAAYYAVPLVMVMCVELLGPVAPLVSVRAEKPRIDLNTRASGLFVGLCLLIGSSGIYYAYFTCFFVAVSALIGWRRRGERIRLFVGAILVGAVIASTLLNLVPYAWYRLQAGPNPASVVRDSNGGEVFALRSALLVLPVRDHRLEAFRHVHDVYSRMLTSVGLDNEANFAAFGIVGALGFAFLLLVLIMGFRANLPRSPQARQLEGIASLSGAGLLFASAGGFGTIIGIVIPQIRAYNRISVFIGFLALFAVGLLLDRLIAKIGQGRQRWAVPLLIACVIVVGVYDQTTPATIPQYEINKTSFESTKAMVSSVEAGVPDGAKIIQLPYMKFPENWIIERMADYDHFKPYLASSKIHWSYGAVKGRPDAEWAKRVSELPAAKLVAEAKAKGFVGVWIDVLGYADDGKTLSADLTAVTGSQPRRSDDGRYLYFAIP